jgi:hypothetical protein
LPAFITAANQSAAGFANLPNRFLGGWPLNEDLTRRLSKQALITRSRRAAPKSNPENTIRIREPLVVDGQPLPSIEYAWCGASGSKIRLVINSGCYTRPQLEQRARQLGWPGVHAGQREFLPTDGTSGADAVEITVSL